jgi:hypothetical protein
MKHPESTNRSAPRLGGNSQAEALEELGGESLVGSGFEAEQPEISPDERNEHDAR